MFVALGPLGTVPGLLVGLLALAAVVLVGRFILNVAWKLLVVAIVVVAVLWLLTGLGIQTGVF